MVLTSTVASRSTLALLAALGLAAVAPPSAAAQTVTLTFTATPQSSTASTSYGNVTMQATTASTTVTFTAGMPQAVALGSLGAGYSVSTFPNGMSVPFSFSFTRALTVTVANTPGTFSFTEPIGGSGFAFRSGSVGQYAEYSFSLNGVASSAGLGTLGTLQAQWQSGNGNSDGISSTSAPLSAVFTFAAAPEPSQTASLFLGALGVSVLALRARRHPA